MSSLRELQGVAHNIADHAESTLSGLHPHMGQVCRLAGVTFAEVELLDAHPYPMILPKFKPLELALQALQAKFWEILKKQSLPRTDVQSVRLEFRRLPLLDEDDYSCYVSSIITAANGKVFQAGFQHNQHLDRQDYENRHQF